MKETYYFSHDYGARNDEKMMYLVAKQGWSGYGIFWVLVEIMHESTDGSINLNLIDGVAHKNNIEISLLNDVIKICIDVELFFKNENGKLCSHRVLSNKDELEKYRQKKSEAGKKGMQARWHNSVITNDNSVITNDNKEKEIKLNKNKEKEIKRIREDFYNKFNSPTKNYD